MPTISQSFIEFDDYSIVSPTGELESQRNHESRDRCFIAGGDHFSL